MLQPDCGLNKTGLARKCWPFLLFGLNDFLMNEVDAGVAKKLHKMNNSD